MCGILGVLSRDARRDWPTLVERGLDALAHRGPDDRGLAVIPGASAPRGAAPLAVLGNVRLAILDLSPNGHMPMPSPDRRVWITYNGELYNFPDLRAELEARGRRFLSSGDTEVVLQAYLEWGDDCLVRLNGMFAFAILDLRENGGRLLIARDPLGIKPCYYVYRGGTFAFASELKGLAAVGMLPDEPDWQALWDYFSYLYVPGPATAYAGVRELPPAHCLVWDFREQTPRERRYWSPLPPPGQGKAAAAEEAAAELRALVTDAVRRQLVSDVPLGVFLSGGIDSTIVTAVAAQATPGRLKTFTVTFEGEGIAPLDDRPHARRVSERYGTEHTELLVDISDPDRMLELISAFDQPFANPTFYLSYLISAVTRRHVTVALSGAGGDELFGGYPRYRALPYARALRFLSTSVGRLGAAAAGRLVPEDPDKPGRRRAKLLLRGIGLPFPEQYLLWTYYLSDREKRRLLAPLAARLDGLLPASRHIERRLEEARVPDLGNRVQYADLETFLADNILAYTDRTSMAVSLEVRVPLLDPRLVAWSFRLPFKKKLSGGASKRILRRAFADLIPQETLDAPKRGFCPPLATWMARTLDRYFDDRMGPAYVARQGVFDWEALQALRQAHRRGQRDNSMELFGVIMFDVWWRRFAGAPG